MKTASTSRDSDVPRAVADLEVTDPGSIEGCLKSQWKRYRKHLKRAQKNFSEKSVHGFRIEARRLMATLDLLNPFLPRKTVERLQGQIKAHLDLSDELRDTQVQVLELKAVHPPDSPMRHFAAWLQKRELRLAKKARKQLAVAKTARMEDLVDAARRELKKELKECSASEVTERLLKSITKIFERTRKLYRCILPTAPATIHRTRVSFKKFRYMAEAVSELVPGLAPEQLCELRAYQALMGHVQDRQVLIETFSRWVIKARPDMDWAMDMRTRLVQGREELVRAYLAQASRLLEFWPPSLSAGTSAVSRPARKRG